MRGATKLEYLAVLRDHGTQTVVGSTMRPVKRTAIRYARELARAKHSGTRIDVYAVLLDYHSTLGAVERSRRHVETLPI